MIFGIGLGLCVFGGSVGSCYAASSSIDADITASRAYGKFVYGEAGHEIKVTVFYRERTSSSAYVESGHVSDVQHENVTEAAASRNSPSGYYYTWGQAYGFVDGAVVIRSREVLVN